MNCPECNSEKNWRNGFRNSRGIKVQRYLCCDCGHRFSESKEETDVISQRFELFHPSSYLAEQMLGCRQFPIKEHLNGSSLFWSENVRPHWLEPLYVTTVGKELNSFRHYSSDCQICVSDDEMKNLAEVKTRNKTGLAGATNEPAKLKETLFEYSWNLQRDGYAESTIVTYTNIMKLLARRGANLDDSNTVKDIIAKQESWGRGRKNNAVKAYSKYLKMHGLSWEKPKYKPVEKIKFIPIEKEIDSLIGGCGKQMATFLQVLKETAARRGEVFNIKWTDIDFARNTITITPEKGSNPRMFKMSNKLVNMITYLPKKSDRIWSYKNGFYLDRGYRRMRKRIATKLGNPRLLRISFHTFRHWKATIEYARTKDTVYVQRMLGHKSIINTLKYIQLVKSQHEETFICKVAKNVEEAAKLIELGFDYVTGDYEDGGKLFRKSDLSYLGS